MLRLFGYFTIIVILGISVNSVFGQEVGLATFQETAQIVVDKSISQNVTASITLQSTSIQEMKIPSELEKKIRENERIIAVILTNEEDCVLGVFDESCIMINVSRDPNDKGIGAIQEDARLIGDSLIGDVNEFFDTEAQFHSVFIHSKDEVNIALDTSGVVSGRGTISAVYTMPQEATDSMYEKIAAILIPKVIRESGGFYDAAKIISTDQESKMTFSIIPMDNTSLFQLKISRTYSAEAESLEKINPLRYLQTEQLKRSEYFSGGFYPLNSIIQVVILSSGTEISNVEGSILPTQVIDGEKIPMELDKNGWVFDPEQGEMIQGKYLFGKEMQVNSGELIFSVGQKETEIVDNPIEDEFDESIIVLVIIAIGAAAAVVYFLRGYRR